MNVDRVYETEPAYRGQGIDQKINFYRFNHPVKFMQVLLQDISTYETRAISQACMLTDVKVHRTSLGMLQTLFDFKAELLRGELMPVGSVEFVSECFSVMGIDLPNWLTYPEELEEFLHRKTKIRSATYLRMQNFSQGLAKPVFIKPVKLKLFNGFVFYPSRKREDYDEHDQEQLDIVMSLDSSSILYVSEVVDFQSEWRYYIDDNKIIGSARYDDGPDAALAPEMDVVLQMIEAMPMSHPYTLDVGRLSTGGTALVETNDAWAIGLYGRALEPKAYLNFLGKRWKSIVEKHLTSNQV